MRFLTFALVALSCSSVWADPFPTPVQVLELSEKDVHFQVSIRLTRHGSGNVVLTDPANYDLVVAEVSIVNTGTVSPRLYFTSWRLETSAGRTKDTKVTKWANGQTFSPFNIPPCFNDISMCILPAGKRVDRELYFAVPKGARITGIRADSFLPVIPVDVTVSP